MGDKKQIVVADLTYIRVNQRCYYLYILMNLSDRYIVGYHIFKHKTAAFDNRLLEDCFKTLNITHLLSKKGNPDDNTVAEVTLKQLKRGL
ncbi:hypothetical protein [Gilliamella sp. WF3-4]|uniref:hypothetical protein n=1 Tax=Gilliamella sp. WF3-4 TaxID=3120255 RepID=UPI00080DA064|nr:hypothetical protein [Gilliamella apicola]OCG17218.1 hypothetical protein A9G47_08855 [Gilliamella apicola]